MTGAQILRLLAAFVLLYLGLNFIHGPLGVLLLAGAGVMWWRILKNRPKPKPRVLTDFDATVSHDNIALDEGRDLLWIRDPKLGDRLVERRDLLSWRTNHDLNNGTFRQRIELQLRDVTDPLWNVLFQRHSDTWIKSSKRNTEERDEWFARLQAWNRSPPAAAATTPPLRDFRISLHESYYSSDNDEHRATYLAAFDMGCNAEGFDQQASWERLGGEYPGPSPALLKHRSEHAQNR